jgi:NAD(P)-dependent dehydrogenase (short-subunit alcohol dehydrogenase family)
MSGSERLVVVTGAAAGIGRETALEFARAGARLALIDLDGPGCEKVAREIEASGGQASADAADLSRTDEIRSVFRRVLQTHGRIDALANVAAIYPTAAVLDVSEQHWDRVLGLDLRGVFFCCQEALRAMFERRSGAIVNVASGAAFRPLPGRVAYSAAKAGLVGMTRVMALEAARHGVRVNVVAPGHTETEGILTSLSAEQRQAAARELVPRRWLAPAEVASAIAYLCSDAASGVNGAILHVNGGHWMP